MNDPMCCTPVCTPVCTPDFSNANFKAKNEVMPQNFQDNILERHRQPVVYTPVCTPVCTNVCTYDFSNEYISGKNEDNATKLSGYYP